MLSREEQIKSEKKVDNIMRFLAGQFGGMNMNMAIDDGPADGARNDGAPSGIGNATVPSSPRLRRLGSSKLIEHGIHGLGDSPSDVMSFDGDALSPSKDADDGEIWEFDDNGQLVKLKTSELWGGSPPISFVPDGSPAKTPRRQNQGADATSPPVIHTHPSSDFCQSSQHGEQGFSRAILCIVFSQPFRQPRWIARGKVPGLV
jgi:hypothetical protein